jgi:hypothetical protein
MSGMAGRFRTLAPRRAGKSTGRSDLIEHVDPRQISAVRNRNLGPIIEHRAASRAQSSVYRRVLRKYTNSSMQEGDDKFHQSSGRKAAPLGGFIQTRPLSSVQRSKSRSIGWVHPNATSWTSPIRRRTTWGMRLVWRNSAQSTHTPNRERAKGRACLKLSKATMAMPFVRFTPSGLKAPSTCCMRFRKKARQAYALRPPTWFW